ncbi:MAG: OsmC family peroxiredoxin [Kiritimatiellae bacterium]|nr:OsmC family peroxiredoxin [Kiritimatiellia bacterium]
MQNRTATAVWKGNLEKGAGRITFGNGRFDETYSAASRFENENETNPEELIAAAHAGCYSMALSHALADAGHTVELIKTEASVHLEKDDDGFSITTIDLYTQGTVPGIEPEVWERFAIGAKENCPVSKALAGCKISLKATLV